MIFVSAAGVRGKWGEELTSCKRQSRTYQPSKTRTIHILSVSFPILTYCSQAQEMLSKNQRIMPGRTSLNVLRSKEGNPGMVGLRGRPIKNCKSKSKHVSTSRREPNEKNMVMDVRRRQHCQSSHREPRAHQRKSSTHKPRRLGKWP